jgi:prevent-host-death family protein
MNHIKISATQAKLQFGSVLLKAKQGTPIIVEKNNQPEMVCISIDDYEDFLEIKDEKFQKNLEKSNKEMKKGKFGNLNNLYKIHRNTIIKESKK